MDPPNTPLPWDLELPLFRPINDVLISDYEIPKPEVVATRLSSNLIHFQTNYAAFFYFYVVVFQPVSSLFFVLLGLIALGGAVAAALAVWLPHQGVRTLWSDHPWLTFGGVALGVKLLLGFFSSVILLLVTLLIPCVAILIHAVLRKRQGTLEEELRLYQKTPMYLLVKAFLA